jgi:hypothetical protein
MLPYVPPHGPSDLPRRSCDETTIYGWLVRSADLAGVHERFDPAMDGEPTIYGSTLG